MSASQHRYTCAQLGVCQGREPGCSAACHPTSDEQRDAPLITPEACMGWLRIALLCLALLPACLLGIFLGSVLLHTFDAEIRQALAGSH